MFDAAHQSEHARTRTLQDSVPIGGAGSHHLHKRPLPGKRDVGRLVDFPGTPISLSQALLRAQAELGGGGSVFKVQKAASISDKFARMRDGLGIVDLLINS